MLKNIVVTCSQHAEAGKSTASKIMQDALPGHFVRKFSFADAFKKTLIDWGFITEHQAYTPEGKQENTNIQWKDVNSSSDNWKDKDPESYVTVRELLRYVGYDLMRKCFLDDIWIRIIDHKLTDFGKNPLPQSAFFDDVRFENEFEFLEKYTTDNNIAYHILYIDDGIEVETEHASERFVTKENLPYASIIDNSVKEYRVLANTLVDWMRHEQLI